MIVVRNCFIAKPGNASKLATMFRDIVIPGVTDAGLVKSARVLTDMTGDFNRVVFEYEVENLAGVDAMMREYTTNTKVRDSMKGYTDLWITGSRELMQVL